MSYDEPIKIKVVLIGESGVGKTSIISRYISNVFNPFQIASIGASFISKTVEINNRTIKYELWDTAGQEQYRSVAKIFYQNASVVILVYDITKQSSFDAIKNYWIKEIKKNIQDDASKNTFNFV